MFSSSMFVHRGGGIVCFAPKKKNPPKGVKSGLFGGHNLAVIHFKFTNEKISLNI